MCEVLLKPIEGKVSGLDENQRPILAQKVTGQLILFAILSFPYHLAQILTAVMDDTLILQWGLFISWYANLSYFFTTSIYEIYVDYVFGKKHYSQIFTKSDSASKSSIIKIWL
jgi:hypothetical protein